MVEKVCHVKKASSSREILFFFFFPECCFSQGPKQPGRNHCRIIIIDINILSSFIYWNLTDTIWGNWVSESLTTRVAWSQINVLVFLRPKAKLSATQKDGVSRQKHNPFAPKQIVKCLESALCVFYHSLWIQFSHSKAMTTMMKQGRHCRLYWAITMSRVLC